MAKKLGEVINKIMEENSSRRAIIVTNHLYILGTIHDYYDTCDNCHECLISLKDVKIARIENLGNCNDSSECSLEHYKEYDWFNIAAHSIVGFSIIK